MYLSPKNECMEREFDEIKKMSFLIKDNDNELLEEFYEIWEKGENSMKKEFDSKPACHEKYLKAKTKSFKSFKQKFSQE